MIRTLIIHNLLTNNRQHRDCIGLQQMCVCYSCIYTVYVIVEYPRITQSPIDLFVNEGGEARFVCQASGDPEPNITWVKVDDRLDGRRSTVRADNSLVITNINIFDEGSKSGATTLLPR